MSTEEEKLNSWQSFGWDVPKEESKEESKEEPQDPVYHILRMGETEPEGPYDQNHLFALIMKGSVAPSDYVYYPALEGWKPLSRVFDIEQEEVELGEDGQEPMVLAESLDFMASRARPGEEVCYIAVQELPALSLTAAIRLTLPKSIVLTNQRVLILNPKLRGETEFEEYPIDQITNATKRINPDKGRGIFILVLKNGDWVELDKIPAAQLKKLEKLVLKMQ